MSGKTTVDFAWKATAAVATLAAGFVADKALGTAWKTITGKPAPNDESQLLDYRLMEVVAFAALSGAALAVTRELALRKAAAWYGGRGHNPLTA
ncbi:hypothetical protein CHIBA101_0118 [Actinomyces sp. Chiba101]|uniref:DUF4235 domain-containing protein n=1 Tax=Actinomyces denticolens TaxID=52767 RepID=A0ABY1IF21_9ACTO|nr:MULTISPECIES: DUF4235 domain-containing protein [Actinomyces]BAW91993.1 hypothetical protein CHIBA101_0118 [Actinomyces sp. Chiba101]GAV95076.1 hypothetical protein ADENT20671_1854 [Actinomyces denticolens]SHJ08085.1 Protein of unknown function [Actinomyces denticolens]SUU12106.1 Uncharacterised protein [Actinomyces denticolens]